MKGAEQRLKSEMEFQKWIAWHIALLPYSNKVPSFRDFIGADRATPRTARQSPEAMLAAAQAWHQQINKGKH